MTYLPLYWRNKQEITIFILKSIQSEFYFLFFMHFPIILDIFSSILLHSLLIFFCATSEEIFTFFILLLVLLIDFRLFFLSMKRARKSRLRKGKLSSLIFFYFSRFDFTRFMCNFMPSNFIFTRVKC